MLSNAFIPWEKMPGKDRDNRIVRKRNSCDNTIYLF